MAKWKLCFLLLLLLTVCFGIKDSEVSLVKTIGSEPDITELCTNSTLSIITIIVCKIRTERNRPAVCRLLYQYGKDFEHQCDSRFKLILENQTVFLQLTGLTPVDSGNHSCECSTPEGTIILHLNVTVEGVSEDAVVNSTRMPIPSVYVAVTVFMITTAVILGLVYRRILHRRIPETLSGRPNSEPQDIEPYSTFIRRESGLYSTVRVNTSNSDMLTRDATHAGKVL
ncbi:uncharacterized protein LOC119015602 isoform X2 [Acanthopagrus latus]|uniref:uncharacterized protein LOC119015602 isoform X2 n=1 Tax=Acanthopagrus latus TaxID=8177 RepID=UPI00187CA60D|nr:uncharacterized protein LOC119015602 isoform X2 [Acanthopagrus latus]